MQPGAGTVALPSGLYVPMGQVPQVGGSPLPPAQTHLKLIRSKPASQPPDEQLSGMSHLLQFLSVQGVQRPAHATVRAGQLATASEARARRMCVVKYVVEYGATGRFGCGRPWAPQSQTLHGPPIRRAPKLTHRTCRQAQHNSRGSTLCSRGPRSRPCNWRCMRLRGFGAACKARGGGGGGGRGAHGQKGVGIRCRMVERVLYASCVCVSRGRRASHPRPCFMPLRTENEGRVPPLGYARPHADARRRTTQRAWRPQGEEERQRAGAASRPSAPQLPPAWERYPGAHEVQ